MFVVNSCINVSYKPLSYSNSRSLFSAEERAKQTGKTIESIREKVPGAEIILVESGTSCDLPFNVNELADRYIYAGDNFFVRICADSPFKGLGEAVSLISIIGLIDKSSYVFKLSGRYFLNDNFLLNQWISDDKITFKFQNKDYISTVLYSVPYSKLGWWLFALFSCIPLLLLNRSIEYCLFRFIPKNFIHRIDDMGVSGYVAIDGELFNG